MSRSTPLMLVAATLALTLTRPVRAGIADSPFPVLSAGATTFHRSPAVFSSPPSVSASR